MFFLIYFSKISNEYLTNLLSPEENYFNNIYNLSLIEVYKQEQLLHGNFDIILIILLAPICEEFFFRCFFLKKMLNDGLSVTASIFVSSFLFGFSHINIWQSLTAFLIGNFIGIIFYRTNFFFCIFSHSLNNIFTILFTLLCRKTCLSRIWSSSFLSFVGLFLTLQLLFSQTTLICKICQNSINSHIIS